MVGPVRVGQKGLPGEDGLPGGQGFRGKDGLQGRPGLIGRKVEQIYLFFPDKQLLF